MKNYNFNIVKKSTKKPMPDIIKIKKLKFKKKIIQKLDS